MKSKDYLKETLAHREPGRIVVDFGATPVTGIHVLAIERLREHYGLERKPVKVIEPYQMLGEIDIDLMTLMGIDVIGIAPRNNMFGVPNENYRSFQTFWGQEVLMPAGLNTNIGSNGDLLVYPEGDMTVPPSGRMPKSGYFFDSIIRQHPFKEADLNVQDNLEEFSLYSDEDIAYWNNMKAGIEGTDKGVILNPGGTAFGDIALVPGPFMKNPRGIRDIEEWYMSTLVRPDYIHAIFDKQSEIAVGNLATLKEIFGDSIDAIFLCGTDFGTQDSTFCSEETFSELYKPYYRKLNDWIHANTSWKTFKHSCGAVEPLMEQLIDAGFDIINPVQINAKGMDPENLKIKYGDRLTFWGGGVNTQKVLPFGNPEETRRQVLEQCRILGRSGGFVFNTVHNIQ
ncbi:MAG TPA: methyltransferase, partial [Bacteroides sp.]|nr:methyltransferase [Bacteroides sp.]